jgi:hypothetical protein
VEDPVSFVSSGERYRLPHSQQQQQQQQHQEQQLFHQEKFNPWAAVTTTSNSPDNSSLSPPPTNRRDYQTSFHSSKFMLHSPQSVGFTTPTTMKGKDLG